MAAASEVSRIERFGSTERLVHWIHAAAFGGLLLSGCALYSPALAGVFGSRQTIKAIHVTIAAAWMAGVLLTVALGDRRSLRRTIGELERFDEDDLRWLRGRPAPQGRFNAGQKVHAVLQAAFAILFVVSGSLLLAGERDTDLRLAGTVALHDALTVVATALAIGHVYLAVVHRSTRPALAGMLTGAVRADWAAEHHSKWQPGERVPRPRASRRERLATLFWLVAAVAAVVFLQALR